VSRISLFSRRQPALVLPDGFAEAEYLRINPDVAAAIKARVWPSAAFHWFYVGKYQGRRFRADDQGDRGRELFSEATYLSTYPDVARSVAEGGFASGAEHFARHGRHEGRLPRALPFDFDEATYLRAHPDVAEAVARRRFDSGASHWLTLGGAEGRRCWARVDRNELPPDFDERDYLLENPNVADMISRKEIESAASHWLMRGRYFGKPPSSSSSYHDDATRDVFATQLIADDDSFDEELYLLCNPDVKRAVDQRVFQSGLDHWRRIGREQNRLDNPKICHDELYGDVPSKPQIDHALVSEDFDSIAYALMHKDILQAYGTDWNACKNHWILHGSREGRHGPGARLFAGRQPSVERVLQKPFGINVYGPFAATSGLGSAARNLVAAIRASGVPYELHILDVSRGPARVTREEAARPGKYRANLILANADQVEHFLQLYPAGYFDGHYSIAMWAWELPSFRPDWFGYFGAVDEVWTYSKFSVDSIAASAPVPVVKVPPPILTKIVPETNAREYFSIPPDKFVFLTVFDIGSTFARKNPMAAVKAFREISAREADAFLIIKFHASGNFEPKLTRELSRAIGRTKNARLICERLSEHEMAVLRASADCLISTHRSEGYGLNIAEFMALGKTVIATDYSGNLEFFSEEVGYPIDYRLVEIEDSAGPYFPGYIWADPDATSLVDQMKAAMADRRRNERGAAAKARTNDFSPEAIGVLIKSRLRELGLDSGSASTRPEFAKFLGRSKMAAMPAPFRDRTAAMRQELLQMAYQPRLSVLVPVYDVDPSFLRQCIDSVRSQSYPFWELCLCDDASSRQDTISALESYRGSDARIKVRRLSRNGGISRTTNAALEMATGDFVVLLDNDDILFPDALLEVARALNEDRTIDCMYSDEIKIDEDGKVVDHFMKPDWSPEHLESVMYVLHMLVVRKRLLLEFGGFRSQFDGAQDFDLMLRVSRATERVHHIPRVLYQWRAITGSAAKVVDAKPYALEAGLRALTEHVSEKYGDGARAEKGLLPGTFRTRRPLDERLPVTLLILTNNGTIELPNRGMVRLVDNFVDSILAKTTYSNYTIVVVDNSRLAPEQIERFDLLGVRVENFVAPFPSFNFAAKANFSLRCARTEHVVFLNDDMEVIDGEWLTALMEFSQDPDIGAVGAKLIHADGTLQHVGMILGVNGGATHPYHRSPGDFVGYNAFTHIIRNYAAVTGACLASRKSVIGQAGLFDERFAIDYNDTDLCLRILSCGYRIVYTPFACLYHYEGVSAKRTSQNSAEVELFMQKWSSLIDNDPYYNVNLSRDGEAFRLREV
jgi:GT2 family glycosyltransferase/glycosyltransferase involved in cell wall biosynthesis